jgi:hypothetical protein
MAAMIGAIAGRPELVERFRGRWLGIRRVAARRLIRRGVAEGRLRADVDPDVVADALYAPLFFRFLMGAPPTPEAADTVARIVVEGVRARVRAGRPPSPPSPRR